MSIAGKELCDCGKLATWTYMPGYSNGGNPFSCDDCVPRGCSCNHRYVDVNAYHPPLDSPEVPTKRDEPWAWIEEGKVWTHVDELGRQFPCCEYDHEKDGWEKD
jgi:hypothetical protein